MSREDLSRSESTTYVCRCGNLYAASVWRRVDADARPELLEATLLHGAVDGRCPACGSSALSTPTWLALYPSAQEARLMIDGNRRASVFDELIEHARRLKADPFGVVPWVVQPIIDFIDRVEEDTARRAMPSRPEAVPAGGAEVVPLPTAAMRAAEGDALAAPRKVARQPTPALGLPIPAVPKPTVGKPSQPLLPLPDPASLFSDPKAQGAQRPAAAGNARAAAPLRAGQTRPPDAQPAEARVVGSQPTGDTHVGPHPTAPPAGAPVELNTLHADPDSLEAGVPRPRSDPKSLEAGVPMMIGSDAARPPAAAAVRRGLGGFVAALTAEGGQVRIAVNVPDEVLEQWEGAKIDARPVHLRGRGYPLVGVRLVAKHFGQVGCIDAVVDPGHPLAAEAFRALSERFAVEARLSGSQRTVSRTVVEEGLEPNAALCIESARGLLARGEYPPEDFARARDALEAESPAERLKPPVETIALGAYQHLVGGAEATRAMEHLDRVSQKDSLARLLEVDGMPMAEYDAIRRRVLEGSLAHGLCAPRRFWRRLVASGLANDLGDYARKLAENRAAHAGEEGDLPAPAADAAWQEIYDLCRRKDIPIPRSVLDALGLPQTAAGARPPARRTSAAGEIRAGEINTEDAGTTQAPVTSASTNASADDLLRDPVHRLRAASDILQGHAHGDVDLVLAALDAFDTDELLAIMPDLSDLGPRAVPGLIAKLASKRREVRQAAVILLGMSMEPDALDHLADHLVREPSTVWVDVARALGGFGPSSIRVLCQILRREAATERESVAIDRVSRAMAEVALSDGEAAYSSDPGVGEASGSAAVEALADAADPRVSTAARRALASLKDVRSSGAQIRGEIPLAEVTEVRGFSRRAYEAIMVPELDVEAEG